MYIKHYTQQSSCLDPVFVFTERTYIYCKCVMFNRWRFNTKRKTTNNKKKKKTRFVSSNVCEKIIINVIPLCVGFFERNNSKRTKVLCVCALSMYFFQMLQCSIYFDIFLLWYSIIFFHSFMSLDRSISLGRSQFGHGAI